MRFTQGFFLFSFNSNCPPSECSFIARADAAAEVRALFESRMPLYRALANVIVDTKQSQIACVEKLVSAFQ